MGRFEISDSSTDSFDPSVEDPNYEPDQGSPDQSDHQDDPNTITLGSLENMLDSMYRNQEWKDHDPELIVAARENVVQLVNPDSLERIGELDMQAHLSVNYKRLVNNSTQRYYIIFMTHRL